MEDKLICKFGTLQPNGLNVSIHQFGEDMYTKWEMDLFLT